MANEKPAVARPTCSILDTNVLVSATASQRELHGTAQSVMRWLAFGRQIYVSGQNQADFRQFEDLVEAIPLASIA